MPAGTRSGGVPRLLCPRAGPHLPTNQLPCGTRSSVSGRAGPARHPRRLPRPLRCRARAPGPHRRRWRPLSVGAALLLLHQTMLPQQHRMASRSTRAAPAALRLLALFLCVQAASATIAYDIEKPWKLWTRHAVHAMLTVLLSLDYWFIMIVHVLLCIAFWHCEAIAANTKTGDSPLPGAGFCKVGFRQSWPGESSSNSIKNIDTTHFWQQVPVINNYLTSLLVFTLSFFNQQAYGKLMSCLGAASQANGAMNNIAFFCFAHIRDRPTARNLMRLLHAFHHLAYMEFGAKTANPRSWEMLQDRHLLTAEECAYLKDAKRCGSKKTIHVLSWAVQIVSREQREGRIPPPAFNLIFSDLMSLRGACGSLKSLTENPIPFGYMFAVNLLLYCWAISVGLFFAGFLSVYGSVAYALVVYIFFNLRLIGIQLSEPFGYEDRHLPVPEILMRTFVDHRELLADSTLPIGDSVDKASPVDSAPALDFCAPFEATYDRVFMTNFKASEANKQMAFAQERFGFPGITEEDRFKGVGDPTVVVMGPSSSSFAHKTK